MVTKARSKGILCLREIGEVQIRSGNLVSSETLTSLTSTTLVYSMQTRTLFVVLVS